MSSSEQGTPDPADLGGLPAGAGRSAGWSSASGPRHAGGQAPTPGHGPWDDDADPLGRDVTDDGDRADGDTEPTGVVGRRIGGRRARKGQGGDGRGSFLRELPVLVLIAFVLALLIKALLVQAFWIPSESMERTLLINDRVLVNKVIYHFRDVHRGDIVVFNGDGTGFQSHESAIEPPSNGFSRFIRGVQNLLGLGAPSDKDFIKRVIGVGGDTVSCCDDAGRVIVNGKSLDETYLFENDSQPFDPVKVPEGQLWVMGDHRSASSDSRANGTIPTSAVVGRAFVKVWPLSRFGFLSTPDTFDGIPAASGTAPVGGAPAPAGGGDPVLPAGTPASAPLAGVLALTLRSRGVGGSRPGGAGFLSDRRRGSRRIRDSFPIDQAEREGPEAGPKGRRSGGPRTGRAWRRRSR
ncbi:signal peptidase I [Frankia sp. CNm7]|uniref:Signal peptidase I n=1 Tax=Frankia nepalensis TaxID=1836974 RepID=A0A937RDY2_9ACTN|nr:signal peptidase I [Frankia nepalensis]MBL7497030.1 signal peptidase I [Frankia nepalensis]MBL7510502.1 signal peptidase I [Frankia nepalensis]MBL7517078.1 signal peptidase I [Frankia nepalensis]MBL7628655.1 signal peptidase I [Frankia nepalensis]